MDKAAAIDSSPDEKPVRVKDSPLERHATLTNFLMSIILLGGGVFANSMLDIQQKMYDSQIDTLEILVKNSTTIIFHDRDIKNNSTNIKLLDIRIDKTHDMIRGVKVDYETIKKRLQDKEKDNGTN